MFVYGLLVSKLNMEQRVRYVPWLGPILGAVLIGLSTSFASFLSKKIPNKNFQCQIEKDILFLLSGCS